MISLVGMTDEGYTGELHLFSFSALVMWLVMIDVKTQWFLFAELYCGDLVDVMFSSCSVM